MVFYFLKEFLLPDQSSESIFFKCFIRNKRNIIRQNKWSLGKEGNEHNNECFFIWKKEEVIIQPRPEWLRKLLFLRLTHYQLLSLKSLYWMTSLSESLKVGFLSKWQEQSPYLSPRFLKFNIYDFSVLDKNGNKIQDKTSRKEIKKRTILWILTNCFFLILQGTFLNQSF